MPSGEAAISARGISKSFGEVQALIEVDLDVARGTVLGLLGPNGAGKTTLVRILTTLLRPDSGSAHVAGLDVLGQEAELRERIGLAGQYAAVDENLTGLENLTMVGRLYGIAPRTCQGTRSGATGAVRSDGRCQPVRQDLFRRHAPAAGPRRGPGCEAPRLVPG